MRCCLDYLADSDGDGLTDGEERDTYKTDMLNSDTDGKAFYRVRGE